MLAGLSEETLLFLMAKTHSMAVTRAISAYTRPARGRDIRVEDLPYQWPAGVFSLGHVSLPFPIDDPVYGLVRARGAKPEFSLGALAPKGESGALVVSPGTFARLRSNPFWGVIQAKVIEGERPTRAARPAP